MKVTTLSKTPNPEKLVCQAARGCYYDGFIGEDKYEKIMAGVEGHTIAEKEEWLIHDLLSKGHYGPFEHAMISFAVKGVSRALMAQATRHRHMTFDVQSQRYVNFDSAGAIVPRSLVAASLNREGGLTELDEPTRLHLRGKFDRIVHDCIELYKEMVDCGVPKEDARFILPIATPVNMTFSGNARTMIHFLDMRFKSDAQWEIREMSEKILDELETWMPITASYYRKNRPNKLAP